MKTDLYNLTLKEAHDILASRQASSVDLTASVLDRIDSVEGKVKAFVRVTRQNAMDMAKEADKNLANGSYSQITGIPLQLKDNMCYKGIPTTCSSYMLEGFVPHYSATVVDKLQSQQAVIVGKGNMDEFAMGSSTENSAFSKTYNPWDLKRVPGGSSGGPAAAVSAGECIYSLGSDTGGSIRQPASLCGVVGLKPTYGLVSRYGLVAFASSLDQIGPLTKNVSDCAIVLNQIAGHDYRDSTSIQHKIPNYTEALRSDIRGLRIGVPKEYYSDGTDPEISKTIWTALKTLEAQGAIVEETTLPYTDYALAVYYILAPAEASANLARYDGVKYGFAYDGIDDMWKTMEKTKQHGFGPEVKRRIMLGTYALSSGYYDAYYMKAQKVRTLIIQDFQNAFNKYDVLITPTSPSVAFKIGEKDKDPVQMYKSDLCTIPPSIAGIPAISIPCGFVNNLPVGMQIIAKHLGEETILRTAYTYEQSTNWHTMRPPL
jgi:aspartyl-tRNA(Asn)/glutamyl-tRNA(Gln) amidotransferase subunit A